MKIQKLLLSLLASAALFVACGEEKEPEPTIPQLNVDQVELTFEQGGGTGTITVTSNRPWSITTDADWLAFNPTQGTASDSPVSVTVTALANSSNDRTSSFKVKTDFDYRTVNVTQKGAKGEDPNTTPTGTGTQSDPYNVIAAIAAVADLSWTSNTEYQTTDVVYVKGIISRIAENGTFTGGGSFGNASFFISTDGTTNNEFQVYRCLYLGNKKYKSGQTDIKVGDEVIICGKLMNYKGNTPETDANNAYVYSLNGETASQGGEEPEAKGTGTLEDPYNPAGAAAAVKNLTWTSNTEYQTTDDVYVKGKISRIAEKGTFTESGTFGNATFFISEDGEQSGEFQVYRVLYLGNKKYEEGQTDIKVGDEVIICGKLMNYRGNTPETEAGKAYVYSLNGETGGGSGEEEIGDPKGTGTLEDPYNPAGAAAAVKNLTWTSNTEYQTTDDVYVKGKISRIAEKGTFTESGTFGNATFFISEDGEQSGEFQVYRVLYLGNKKYEEGQTDIKVGDEVIICGKLMNYRGNTPETEAGKAYVYSLNGATGGDEPDPGEEIVEATVAEAIAAEKDAKLKVGPAVVVAASDAGFLMEQDGAMIYVYRGKASVGDNVTVQATKAEYSGAPQLSDPEVTVNSTGTEVTYPEPKDITATFDSYSSQTREYVTYKGTLAISGNYYNVTVDGAEVKGSVLKPLNNVTSLDGKEVVITGYYLYHTTTKAGDKYLYVITTDIKATDGTEPGGEEPGGDEPGESEEIKAVSIAEFLAAEDSKTQPYKLTGKVGKIVNSTYGNFDLTDATGTVYVYGLVAKDLGGYGPNKANDKSFASIGIKEGDEITIIGYRETFTDDSGSKDEVVGSYYVSGASGGSDEPGGGETPGGDLTNPFTSNVKWTKGENASDAKATVNGQEITALKLGTSSKVGVATIVLPKGSTSITFYGVAWKDKKSTLSAKIGDTEVFSQALAANDGAAGNPPFTMTVSASDCYTKTFDALAADTTLTLTTTGSNSRVVLFGINVK